MFDAVCIDTFLMYKQKHIFEVEPRPSVEIEIISLIICAYSVGKQIFFIFISLKKIDNFYSFGRILHQLNNIPVI